jgi:hypothetical protein
MPLAVALKRARERHCCPSRHHIEGSFKLGRWVCIQRYFKDKLLPERKRRLGAIGFVWDWRDYLWEQNFSALLKFKRREGHCCVPTHYRNGNLKLGWWVATQRRNKKEMSAQRRERLNKLGFVWSVGFTGPIAYRPSPPRTQGAKCMMSTFGRYCCKSSCQHA